MIIFVRHAQSAANAGQSTESPDSIALTEAGIQQAAAFARAWSSRPSRILSSPYLRAMQTAQPLASKFNLEVMTAPVQEFTYLCPAKCAGTTVAERRSWVAEYWKASDPDFRDGPEAETFREFVERTKVALQLVRVLGSGMVVVFCHGQFMQMVRWLGADPLRVIDPSAMRAFRSVDLEHPIHHCEQYQLPPD